MVQRTSPSNDTAPRRTLLFLHGFSLAPIFYRGMLRRLRGDGVRLLAPFIYNNNWAADPPVTIPRCIERTRAVARDVAGPIVIVGHSTGAMVGMHAFWGDPRVERMVLMNQVVPVPYGWREFSRRGSRILWHQLTGRAGPLAAAYGHIAVTALPLAATVIRRPGRSRAMMRMLAAYDFPEPDRPHPAAPGRIHILHTGADEFFDYDRAWPAWLLAAEPVIERVPFEGHEWPMIDARRAAAVAGEHLPGGW